MVLGPLGPWSQTTGSNGQGDSLLAAVGSIAARLNDDLDVAQRLTGDWTDEPLAQAMVDVALSKSLEALAATGCWGQDNRLPSSELWRVAGQRLATGWLQTHARLKPRGYAGDYLMLLRICQRHCCEHPLGRFFDGYFQRQAAPQAVRNRTEQIALAVASHVLLSPRDACHVVSVGSGPALDLHQAISLIPKDRRARLRITLMDVDPEALDVARANLEPLLAHGALVSSRVNLFRLSQGNSSRHFPDRADILVSSGMFDYLEPDPAAAMLRLFWERLSPGGLLLVGNFSPHNPSRAYMEWIGNWYLLYRTPEELDQLGHAAGIPRDHRTVACERTGVNLFLRAWK